MDKPSSLLGGLSANRFLRNYWQKNPLLIRQAMPGFKGLLDRQQLLELACDPDVQARAVVYRRNKWELYHAPFDAEDFAGMETMKWTVLVQGVNHYLPQAAELLQYFDFVPHARLDDLMVSYASKGGGVGPHFDSYDVFLLQGAGRRRWQISQQQDRTLVEGAPLKILRDFKVEQEWVLEPGDMLYLPPHCAHNGIAENSECMTYSIGFRTPAYHELAEQFLVYLQDRIRIEGMYTDPGLKTQKHPSEIGPAMLDQVAHAIDQIQWNKHDVAAFLGCYLSEPKPHIFFDAPARPLSRDKFAQALQSRGAALDLKTQMLCHGRSIFINGEAHIVNKETYRVLRTLADSRRLPAGTGLPEQAHDLLYQWYVGGYISPMTNRRKTSS
jgi:50S ribosomal protein L16 3-hydroxylase